MEECLSNRKEEDGSEECSENKMAYQYQMYKDENLEEQDLQFDLRQAFVILTTEVKKQIIVARTEKNFTKWFELLDSLYIEICKNLSPQEMDEYEKLLLKQTEILEKYSHSYLKKNHKNDNEVYKALRMLDIWINRKMQEKRMFGAKDRYEPGL